VLFFLNTLFSTVVMLNLLISIIGDTYGRVKENSESAAYQEKARMVAENAYLIPNKVKEDHCPKNYYLLFAHDNAENLSQSDQLEEKLELLKTKIEAMDSSNKETLAEIQANLKELLASKKSE